MQVMLAKLAFNILVMVLQKLGVLTKIEATAVRTGDNVLRAIEHIKTYQEYPTGVNGKMQGTNDAAG